MIPELSIGHVFQRELDALPLPPEDLWLPRRERTAAPTIALALACLAFVLVVLVTVVGLQARPEAATAGDAPATRAPLPFACDVGGRCVGPLPNLYRSPAFGYNLVVPSSFRRADDGATPAAPGSGLLRRERFTARSAGEDAAALARYGPVPPWDFVVEVYDGTVVSAAERARLDGCGVDCVTTQATIRQAPGLSATWASSVLVTHAYYLERSGRLFVLTYVVGPDDTRPALVNESDLLRIVEMIGLE